MWINLPGLAGLWTVHKPAMFRGIILKDSSAISCICKTSCCPTHTPDVTTLGSILDSLLSWEFGFSLEDGATQWYYNHWRSQSTSQPASVNLLCSFNVVQCHHPNCYLHQHSMCGVPPFKYICFFSTPIVPTNKNVWCPSSLYTYSLCGFPPPHTWPKLNYKSISTCISECGTSSWATEEKKTIVSTKQMYKSLLKCIYQK